ncbi:MAG: ATP-binding cassette domain-containing protein [Proteobacteria bacterium]|nr:ATP-binding cassette domain-containing protein [Pseudomonadota bacterium]
MPAEAPARLRLAGLRSALAGPFDLTLAAGECVAITGPSGAGKSLLLRMIADLDPNQGEVWLDGQERATWSAPEWRRQVVYNAAEAGWWGEQVAPHFPAAALAATQLLAPRLGLDPALLEASVSRLSTGERQRLALLRALAGAPAVLLLDEPTGALDETSTGLVEALLAARLATGCTILMVTHNPAQAARMGRRHLRLADRRLVGT